MAPRKAAPTAPDRAAMERALTAFLAATGAPLDDPELAQTPGRAAQAWAEEFVDGYGRSVAEALGEPSRAPPGAGLVLVTGLDFTSVCPHHLLPYRGVAHLAYQPGKHLAGFGRLAVLLDALAHRLVLQETLAGDLAQALVDGLGAKGAGVILEAEQACLTLRGEKRARSRTSVDATAGRFDGESLRRLWSASRADPAAGSPR